MVMVESRPDRGHLNECSLKILRQVELDPAVKAVDEKGIAIINLRQQN
jgi:hypothetical protein